MNVGFQIDGLDRMNERLARHPERLAMAAESQLKMQARFLARDLARETAPVGFGERARAGIAKRVAQDVRLMFPANQLSQRNASRVYELIKAEFDEGTADAFWREWRKGNRAKAERYMRRRGIKRGVDENEYERRRKAGDLRGAPIALAAESRVESMIRRRQKRVGMAKAGWYQAARGVGGRLRVTNSGNGKTVAAFPKWVIAAGSGLALGGATVQSGPRPMVTIFSNVRHGKKALRREVMAKALAATQVRLRKVVEQAVKAENKKRFKR